MLKDEPSTSTRIKTQQPADFEKAILACGFGYFNIYLLCVSISDVTSTIFTISTMSYIVPSAECDLSLGLMTKGMLNAMPFAGMILSAIPWGYVADTMGRRKVLIYGLLVDGLLVLCSGLSQNVYQLLAFKFVDGLVVSGPIAVMMSYLSEYHGVQYRSRIMMITGMMNSLATLILPVTAYAMLPHHFQVETEYFRVHSWQFFIMFTAIVPLCGGFLHVFFPESPKFLMSQGRNEEALKCLQQIYAVNTGKPKETYPISTLVDENPGKAQRYHERNSIEYKSYVKTMNIANKRKLAHKDFVEGLKQLQPLCANPHLILSMRVYSLLFCILLGLNSIRLWLPQLFATMVEYEHHEMGVSSMCAILSYSLNKTKLWQSEKVEAASCDMHITPDSYTNNIIVSAILFCGYLMASFCINKLGNNNVLRITLALSFIFGTSLYFSKSSKMTLVISAIFITACSVSTTTVISASVNLFPTNMRTMAVTMALTFGRCGSILGNIIFPYFISMGCLPPFVLIGCVMLLAFTMSLFLPNSSTVSLL